MDYGGKQMTFREKIQKKIEKKYGTAPEYLWKRSPSHAIYRHADNRKWFALIGTVSYHTIGMEQAGYVDIINVRCDPDMAGILWQQEGIFPGYHMNHRSWITLLLDGTVPEQQIMSLLDESFCSTDSAAKNRSGKRITQWLIPANPKFFDVDAAFDKEDIIIWKQSSNIQVGDTVYMYVAAPFSAIRYKCRAVEVNIPYAYQDDHLQIRNVMRIQKLMKYDQAPVGRDILKEHGVLYVRGPRSIPASLVHAIAVMYQDADSAARTDEGRKC